MRAPLARGSDASQTQSILGVPPMPSKNDSERAFDSALAAMRSLVRQMEQLRSRREASSADELRQLRAEVLRRHDSSTELRRAIPR